MAYYHCVFSSCSDNLVLNAQISGQKFAQKNLAIQIIYKHTSATPFN